MKIQVTEQQLKNIISEISSEVDEQTESDPVSPDPVSGASAKQSGGEGYPEVGKWESEATRGPANQIGITKWSDVVGSTLKRGKANKLK